MKKIYLTYKITAMKKQNKYTYTRVIQQNFGQGWEDSSDYQTDSQGNPKEWIEATKKDGVSKRKVSLLRHDLREYKIMGYPTRVISRKVTNTVV